MSLIAERRTISKVLSSVKLIRFLEIFWLRRGSLVSTDNITDNLTIQQQSLQETGYGGGQVESGITTAAFTKQTRWCTIHSKIYKGHLHWLCMYNMLHVPEQYALHRSSLQSQPDGPLLYKAHLFRKKKKKNLIYIFQNNVSERKKKAMTPQQVNRF